MWNASDHYDARSRPGISKSKAMAERSSGPSAAIKRYHNDIKRRLIDIFAHGAPRYLDIACGRGGDISKWTFSNIGFVRGIDVSRGEIDEARHRYASVRPPPKTRCTFDVVPTAARWTSPDNEPYNVVACMFAIHYFFGDADTARSFFATVAASLEIGGFFIGTFPDGHRVLRAANNSMMTVDVEEKGEGDEFGRVYSFSIVDTVVDREGSREFLVFPETLLRLAAEHDLEPVVGYDMRLLADFREPCIKHFTSRNPDPDARAVSDIYATFAFRRVA